MNQIHPWVCRSSTVSLLPSHMVVKIVSEAIWRIHFSQIEAAFLQDIKAGECLSFDIVSKRDGREAAENLTRINCSDL